MKRVGLLILMMLGSTLLSGGRPTTETASAQTTPFRCPNNWPLRRGLSMYNIGGSLPQSTLDYIAARFEFTNGGHPDDIAYLTQQHPGFYALIYNSVSDTYVPTATNRFHPEHDWYFANASQYNVDPEDTYLHFWTDTIVTVDRQNFTVPGWQPDSPKPGATATSRDQSRVPVYYNDLSRIAVNFGDIPDSPLRRLHRAYHIAYTQQPIRLGLYWGGVMFDNAAYYHLALSLPKDPQTRLPLLGGQVAEHPTKALVDSADFNRWYYFDNEGAFMRELRLWAASNPPELEGRSFKVALNAAGVPFIASTDWDQAYVTLHPADLIIQEFHYSPTRNTGENLPATIFQKNVLAQQSGVDIWEIGLAITDRAPLIGTYTVDEAIVSTLALHHVTRTPNVFILGHQVNSPWSTAWSNNTRPVFDVDLGPALGDPHVLQTGTDPHGYPYTVYARQFSCGLAIVRERGSWNQDLGDPSDGSANTEITVQLPGEYIPIDADANAYPPSTTATLRNGQGKILISSTVTNPPCTPDWRCTDWSACVDERETRTCTDRNSCGTNAGRPPESRSCTVCTPNWQCTDWSACVNNQQTRSCTDQNNCGLSVGRPLESQSCTVCQPDWQCGPWGACASGNQYRDCADRNRCGEQPPFSLTTQQCDPTPPSAVTDLRTQ